MNLDLGSFEEFTNLNKSIGKSSIPKNMCVNISVRTEIILENSVELNETDELDKTSDSLFDNSKHFEGMMKPESSKSRLKVTKNITFQPMVRFNGSLYTVQN